MKKCKLIHINDGNPREIRNCDRLFMEDIPRVEDLLDHWLNKGWVVKQMMPLYEPNQLEQGAIGFYLSGINAIWKRNFRTIAPQRTPRTTFIRPISTPMSTPSTDSYRRRNNTAK